MIDRYRPPGENPEVFIGGNPIKFAGTPMPLYRQPPMLGQHGAEIREQFEIESPSDEPQ